MKEFAIIAAILLSGCGKKPIPERRLYLAFVAGENAVPPTSEDAEGNISIEINVADSSCLLQGFVHEIDSLVFLDLVAADSGDVGESMIRLVEFIPLAKLQRKIFAPRVEFEGRNIRNASFARFLEFLEAGLIAVNIGTDSHEGGAVRGQFERFSRFVERREAKR